jgi:putative FmdB family regulatory protein
MATYEYTCLECDKSVALARAIDDRDEPVICDCGEFMKRSFTPPGIAFNGPGFYKTGG